MMEKDIIFKQSFNHRDDPIQHVLPLSMVIIDYLCPVHRPESYRMEECETGLAVRD